MKKATILVFGAAATALLPTGGMAAPHNTAPTQQNGPATTGQPSQDCEELVASGDGARPGHTTTAPGSAFNPAGVSGSVYAGEQTQNSKNTASVSQYDVACAKQPQ